MPNLYPFFLIAILFFMLDTGSAKAQSAQTVLTDSLGQVVKNSKDTTRAIALYQLCRSYLYSDPAKALAAGKEALSLSEKLHFSKGIASSNNNIGNYYYQTGDYQKALDYQKTSLSIRKNLKDNLGIAQSLLNLGNAFYGLGNLKEAMSAYFQGLKYSERIQKDGLTSMIYTNLSNVYLDLKKYDQALNITFKVIKIREELKDSSGLTFSYNTAGVIYLELKQYNRALLYLKKAYAAAEISNNKALSASALANMGFIYSLQHKFVPALSAQQKALVIQNELGDKLGIATSLNYIAASYYALGNLSKAEEYYTAVRRLGEEIKSNKVLLEAYDGLSKVSEKKNSYREALQYYKQHVGFKDSILNETNSRQLSELQTKYETEKKEKEIELLNKENIIQKLSISKRNTTLGIVIAVFVIALSFIWLFYNRYRIKQEARLKTEIIKQQDFSTKAILEAEEKERKRISGELHDGIGQMFSTVKLNLSGIEEHIDFKDISARDNFTKTLSLIDESCKEVRNISHQMAPNALLKSGLAFAVKDFIEKVDERQLKISLDVQGIQERLDPNIEAVLYRVIQEAVNNVIKHAKASRLDIQISKDEEGISAMIEDDGIGFDTKRRETADGIGLTNILSRIQFLKGTVDFDSVPQKGTVVSIWVPLV